MYYDEWLRLGERLGLTGGDLLAFVKEKEGEYIAREDRVRRRDEERRQMEISFELKMKEKDLEIERIKSNKGANGWSNDVLRPKIPKFDDINDNIDAYIERFERFAKAQNWQKESWAMSLSSLLSGKALDVFISMSNEEANDYDVLKNAILKRYQLTEEGFRMKFRQSKPLPGESVFQFIEILRRYFSRWAGLAGIEKSYQGISELLIKEQFIGGCSTGLAIFLKERAPSGITELTRIAEQYIEAHNGTASAFQREQEDQRNVASDQQMNEANKTRIKTCFNCNQTGHLARECKLKVPVKTCFICYKEGHIAKDCPQIQSCAERNGKLAAVCLKADLIERNEEDD